MSDSVPPTPQKKSTRGSRLPIRSPSLNPPNPPPRTPGGSARVPSNTPGTRVPKDAKEKTYPPPDSQIRASGRIKFGQPCTDMQPSTPGGSSTTQNVKPKPPSTCETGCNIIHGNYDNNLMREREGAFVHYVAVDRHPPCSCPDCQSFPTVNPEGGE